MTAFPHADLVALAHASLVIGLTVLLGLVVVLACRCYGSQKERFNGQ